MSCEIKQTTEEMLFSAFDNKDEEVTNLYKELNKELAPGSLLFVGDSLIVYYDVPSFFPDSFTTKRGIKGDLVLRLPERMACSVYDVRPSAIVFWMGLNDLNYTSVTPEILKGRYEIVFEDWVKRYPTLPIVVLSMPPVRLDSQMPVNPKLIAEIPVANTLLKELCQKYDFRFVDVYPLLERDGEQKIEYTFDGAHINRTAYGLITPMVKQALEEERVREIKR